MNNLNLAIHRERKIKLLFFILAIFGVIFALTFIKNIFISFILAFVVFYLLSPAVNFLERTGLSRTWATSLPFFALSLTLGLAINIFLPNLISQFVLLKNNFPSYSLALTQFIQNLEQQIVNLISPISSIDLRNHIEPRIESFLQGTLTSLPDYISQSLTVFLLTPFIAYFMLVDGHDFRRKILSLVPNNYFELALHLNYQISEQLGGFVRARILESFLIGSVVFFGLLFIDFPYALILAIFAGLMNVIPYVGPFIGVIPALIINLANTGGSSITVSILIIYALAQVLDIILIIPFVVAKIIDLHPVTVVLLVIFGAHIGGILGMIICIPVYSVMKVSISTIYRHLIDFRG